jgi:hypothetical protein
MGKYANKTGNRDFPESLFIKYRKITLHIPDSRLIL